MRPLHLRFIVTVVAFWIIATARVFAAGDAGGPAISPTEALERLMAGNERFQNDKTGHPVLHSERREELVGGQSPFAVIFSCSDSRVPPELIFDQGLGGLFVVRIAGNTVTRAGLESIDYAVSHLGTNLIIVLAHDKCGAVKGAVGECSSKPDAGLPEIFANICPAVDLARKKSAGDLESRAIDLNVIEQMKVLKRSALFKKRVADGSVKIVGARYNLQSGKVEFLDAGN
jgi:carbonic anhydrase